MSQIQTTHYRYWLLAALLAPMVATFLVRFGGSAGPRPASADLVMIDASSNPTATPFIDTPSITPTLTPRQAAARDWFARARTQVTDRSPLIRPQPPAKVQQPVTEPTPEPDQQPRIERPDLRVTGMITGGGVEYVSVNHKLARVGDEVAPGWRVETIDIVRGIAVIAHATGQTLELAVERPRLTGGD